MILICHGAFFFNNLCFPIPTCFLTSVMVEIRWCHISPSMVAMDRWVTTGSLIFSLRRVARVATLVFSFTGRPAIGMAATWDGLICFDYFDLLFVDVCCLGCLWIFFSETGKKHVLYRVATLSSLTLRPTSYDKATLFKNPPFLWPKRMIRTHGTSELRTRGLIRTCWEGIKLT